MATLKEIRDARLHKLAELKKLGINPYPAKSHKDSSAGEIVASFDKFEGNKVVVAGRALSLREHGKALFVDLKDASGAIQVFCKADVLEKADYDNSELTFNDLRLLDFGDFIEVRGSVMKTRMGQISVRAEQIRILAKSLRNMPDSWHGLKDKETRLRRRYLDTNINQEVYERFIRRSKFWQATRDFLTEEGFMEINTPVLEHTTGGADAKPFQTHMDALDHNFYLRISHELPLKRLIGGGYEKVYDIGPRFRNENYSDEHLPEHIAFESYAAYQDYEEGIKLYERMMKEVAKATWGTLQFKINGFEVNLDQKWPIIRYPDIMSDRYGVDVFNPDFDKLKRILKENKVKLEGHLNVARAMDSVWKLIRKQSAGPFWLIHEPVAISPLAKQDPDDDRVTQRFHPVIGGTEMGNGYSELNDPVDQLNRFLEQQAMRDMGDEEAQMLDIDFVEMLEYGMPPTCGWSYSERYFWALEGVSAREGVPFPPMRPEIDAVTAAIYPEVFLGTQTSARKSQVLPQDFDRRIVVVVSNDLEPWRVANAVGHMTAIIGNEIPKKQLVTGDYFFSKDGVKLPRNSQYPIVIKKADETELHKLYSQVEKAKLLHHVFIKEMIETSDDNKIVKTLKTKVADEINFYGIVIFADNKEADRLTKEFQLYK